MSNQSSVNFMRVADQFGKSKTVLDLQPTALYALAAPSTPDAVREAAEELVVECWIAYGAALNEGRGLFPGDREFGQWVAEQVHPQVGGAPHDDERAAAMWAARRPANSSALPQRHGAAHRGGLCLGRGARRGSA